MTAEARIRRGTRTLAGVALLAFGGCGGEPSTVGWTTIRDSLPGGVVHVRNTPPEGGGVVPQVLVEELRIGTVDGTGPSSFGQLKGLVVTSEGAMVVLDAMAQELRVFAPDGQHLATHGRRGAGPGEMEAGYGLMIDAADRLWIPDHRNARMSVFEAEEGFVESSPMVVLRRGFVWGGTMAADGRVLKPSIALGPPRTNVLRVYGAGMELIDSLPLPADPQFDPEDPPGSFYWEAPGGLPSGYVSVPFYPSGQDFVDPHGMIWSTAAGDPSYRIRRWAPGGDTTLVLETHRETETIPEPERDSAIASIREYLQEVGGAQQDWSKVPTVRPAVSSMFMSAEGELWVETGHDEARRRYDVYGGDGTFSRTVETSLPILSWIPPVVRGDRFWAVVTDELDVPYVVRARIDLPGGS